MLKDGDLLLCDNNRTIQLQAMIFTISPLKVYTIEVKKTHTFLVGFYNVITHNILVPIAASLGLTIPFSIGCSSGTVGAIFGPVGVIGGVVLGRCNWLHC